MSRRDHEEIGEGVTKPGEDETGSGSAFTAGQHLAFSLHQALLSVHAPILLHTLAYQDVARFLKDLSYSRLDLREQHDPALSKDFGYRRIWLSDHGLKLCQYNGIVIELEALETPGTALASTISSMTPGSFLAVSCPLDAPEFTTLTTFVEVQVESRMARVHTREHVNDENGHLIVVLERL